MQPKTKAIVAGALLLVALVSLWFTLGSSTPAVRRDIHKSLGQALAQETALAIHNQGQVVAVIADAFKQSDTTVHLQWESFVSELKSRASISLAAPVIITSSTISLHDILSRHTQASAIVFFVSPPNWDEFQTLTNPQSTPKIIMVGNPDFPAKAYYTQFLTSGFISALILPHSFSNVDQTASAKTSREWFNKYYQVYTLQNIDTLPE